MSKISKLLIGLAVVGTIVGICIAILCKKGHYCDCNKDAFDDFEDDLDLDDNLGPIPNREYVPIKPTTSADTNTVVDDEVKDAQESSEDTSVTS